MTTRIHIVNDDTSNPLQHALVTLRRTGGHEEKKLLGPGESHGFYLHEMEKVEVVEVFETKPGYRHPHNHLHPKD